MLSSYCIIRVEGGIDCAVKNYPAVMADFNRLRLSWIHKIIKKEEKMTGVNINTRMIYKITDESPVQLEILNEKHSGQPKTDAFGTDKLRAIQQSIYKILRFFCFFEFILFPTSSSNLSERTYSGET